MLLRRRSTEHKEEDLDMTPMVDVVFQLMTFLLLTFQATVSSEVEIPAAKYGIGVEQKDATVLTVAMGQGVSDPPVVYGGVTLEAKARLETPEAIKGFVEEGVSAGRKRVVLQADGRVHHGDVLRLGGIVGEVEGVTLHIGVKEPE